MSASAGPRGSRSGACGDHDVGGRSAVVAAVGMLGPAPTRPRSVPQVPMVTGMVPA
jgi:hypothetical protein